MGKIYNRPGSRAFAFQLKEDQKDDDQVQFRVMVVVVVVGVGGQFFFIEGQGSLRIAVQVAAWLSLLGYERRRGGIRSHWLARSSGLKYPRPAVIPGRDGRSRLRGD
jgi:hypothetical protein